MGKNHSKNKFTEWDLDRFSNITKIPRDRVEKLYQEFITSTGKDNTMDKKDFRRLYKEMYASRQLSGDQVGPSAPHLWTEHDLDKIADRVFKAFDKGKTGKLSFEEFCNAYLLLDNSMGPIAPGATRDRYNYIMEQNNPTPGKVSREQGQEFFNHLNQFYANDSDTATDGTKWEHQWTQIDDGSGTVTQEKFVEYITNADDYKTNLKPSST